MKKIFFAVSLALCASAFAGENLDVSLKHLASFYADLNRRDLVELHYYLNFAAAQDVHALLRESALCRHAKNYRPMPEDTILDRIEEQTARAMSIAYSGTDEFIALVQTQKKVLPELEAALEGSKLLVCVDKTTPSYSDGHQVTFVKVDGELEFAFEVGYPD